jgi:hypothetical protein
LGSIQCGELVDKLIKKDFGVDLYKMCGIDKLLKKDFGVDLYKMWGID